MDWGSPEFVLWIIGMSTFGWIVTSWIRARHGYPLENEWSGVVHKENPNDKRQIELLSTENSQLKAQMGRLEERIAVLERIATDPAERTALEIERLR